MSPRPTTLVFCFLPMTLCTASCASLNGVKTTTDPQVRIHANDRDFSDRIDFPTTINPACPDWKSGETVLISTNTTLPENCSYERLTLRITHADVNLDCNNAVFNGLSVLNRNAFFEAYSVENTPQSTGIEIIASEGTGDRLTNISVSNCQFLNYVNGAYIAMGLQASTQASLKAKAVDEQLLRNIAPAHIQFKNLSIINPHKHGIFLHRYITEFSVEDSIINGSGNSGLYLESGTRSSTIKNNMFEGNGFSRYSRSTRIRKPRVSSKARREAIAVDGSRFNTIVGNTFKANGDGGIYLYKNCWEKHDEASQLPRLEGANDNVIESNTFTEETVGVWLAERADRNLANFDCGDAVIYSRFWKMYYRDFARRNIIDNNFFHKNQVGIRVQDNDNIIRDNTFVDTDNDLEIGSIIRTRTADPVTNTTLENNNYSRPNSVLYNDN